MRDFQQMMARKFRLTYKPNIIFWKSKWIVEYETGRITRFRKEKSFKSFDAACRFAAKIYDKEYCPLSKLGNLFSEDSK